MKRVSKVKVDTKYRKQPVRTGIVGGGKGCYELLKLFLCYTPKNLEISIVGVADLRKDAIGREYAEQHGIPTFDRMEDLLQQPNIDLIIELTGSDAVLEEIFEKKSPDTKVLDHLGALFLWEIISIQEEKLNLEQRIALLDTMTAVGEMAFKLTHELRNPLMIAGGTIRRLMTRVDLPHKVRKKLKLVAESLQEMEEVLSDLCDVIRPLHPDFKLVDLNQFFRKFCNDAGIEARFAGCELICLVEDELPEVVIDPSLIRQALWHIVENCFEAAAKTGTMVQLRVVLCYDYILIRIDDEAGGLKDISPGEALSPFATTRPGRMGLGLSLCKQIVLEHGGELELWNNSRGGVTVSIKLPIRFEIPEKDGETGRGNGDEKGHSRIIP